MHCQKQKKLKLKRNVSSCYSLYSEGQLNALWQENSKNCGGNKDNQENNIIILKQDYWGHYCLQCSRLKQTL